MRTLNRTWRGVDRATDVLSFPAEDDPLAASERRAAASRRRHLGDIVIATGVAARQAREAGHAEATEWRVLALHGLLHSSATITSGTPARWRGSRRGCGGGAGCRRV